VATAALDTAGHPAVARPPAGVVATAPPRLTIRAAARRHGWPAVAAVPQPGWQTPTAGAPPHTCLAARHQRGAATAAARYMRATGHQRKRPFFPLFPSPLTPISWNPSSRTPYIADSERSAWDAGSKTPGRPSTFESWGNDSSSPSTTARTPGAYNAGSPEFAGYGSKEFSAPTPGGPMNAPTPSAPTPGPVSAPTPAAWGADTAPTPGASGGYGRGGAYPSTPGTWGGDEDDVPRYSTPSP
jgi:hypothetical protein